MKKNITLFAGLTTLLILIVYVLELVGCASAINDAKRAGEEVLSVTRGLIIFEMISAGVIVFSCFLTSYSTLKKKLEKKIYVSVSVIFLLIVLRAIIDTFWAFAVLKQIYYGISMPGIGIVKLAFLFAALAFIVVGLYLQGSFTNDDKANIFMVMAMGMLFIVCIISFISLSRDSDAVTIAANIFLVLSVILGCFLFISSYYRDDGYRPAYKPGKMIYSSKPTTAEKSDETSDRLRELKKLYDDGVITSEEYNEKRQKYIDKL